jgi:uncharacterized membrane protein YqjE
MLRQIAEFVAVLSCALFTGAVVYITFIEHPARMQCGVEIAATEFVPSYRRATVMQATCAALGLLASVGCLWRIDTVAVKRPKIRETRCDYEL